MLNWEDTRNISFDSTVMFGIGYDFDGLDLFRLEAKGPNGNYLTWPSGRKWSLYRDSDGALAFERYGTELECQEAAERWCADLLHND